MKVRYVRNFNLYAWVLRYDPDSGDYQESPRGSETERLGYYDRVDDGVAGVYASPDGPVCFHNQAQYVLVFGGWDASVTSEDAHDLTSGQNRFTLIHQGQLAFSVTYHAHPDRYYDPWTDPWSADDEAFDLFLWLKNRVRDKWFHSHYTRAWEFGRADLVPPH